MSKLARIDCLFGLQRCGHEEQIRELPECYRHMINLAQIINKNWEAIKKSPKTSPDKK